MTFKDDMTCPHHPKYDGKTEPKNNCDYCWFRFWLHQDVPECFLNEPVEKLEVDESD